MPAIPIHARVEVHLTDEEMLALREFLDEAIAQHEAGAIPRSVDSSVSVLSACKQLDQAIGRSLKERSV